MAKADKAAKRRRTLRTIERAEKKAMRAAAILTMLRIELGALHRAVRKKT